MSFLPIVGRELRGASRRRGTYWVRAMVATAAVITGAGIFLATLGTPAAQSGRVIFQGLSALLLLCCLVSGRGLTVDCLSVEKREGTLGLLFLTDLKGYDVVLGKLAATSLNGFYSLLAVLPVLALSMLLGAVADAEFWRMVLVLADTFLFSLAVGIFCSALSRDARRASAANFALMLLFVGVLPAVAGAIAYFRPSHPQIPQWLYACPGYPFFLSFDANYKFRAEDFWWSVGVIHALTWMMILIASWVVPRTWQDKPARAEKTPWRDLWKAWNYGPASGRAPFRKRMLDVNAFYWLAGRARLKPLHVWTFLGFMACWWTWSLLRAGDIWGSDVVVIVSGLILNSMLKLWITVEAGQQLAEDQRMGTLELLLPTPLGARDILHGQWLALRRQFLKPLLAVIAAELLLAYITIHHRGGDRQLTILVVTGVLALLADGYALVWVAMRSALTARNPSRAAFATVSRILILPWGGCGAINLLIDVWNILWPEKSFDPEWRFELGLWFGLGLAADLLFGLTARHQLLADFRRLAMHRFEPRPSRLARWLALVFNRRPSATGTASLQAEDRLLHLKRRRRKLAAFGVLVVLLAGAVLIEQRRREIRYPPPVVVSITQSNTPLFISPGQQTLMVLPDGSLWLWGGNAAAGWQPGNKALEQIGESRDWTQVNGGYNSGIALRRDGTMWEWGIALQGRVGRPVGLDSEPVPAQSGHDWISAVRSGADSFAIKRDGSLWAWGNNSLNQLGNGPGPNQTNAIQVGTDNNWAAIRAYGAARVGLRTDGTLWTWGRTVFVSNGVSRLRQIVLPTQVCRETNWVALEKGSSYLAWTATGELWQLAPGSADAEASVTTSGQLILTNSRPGRFAIAMHYGDQTRATLFYQVRDDGTLWQNELQGNARISMPVLIAGDDWRQVGSRSDWISIWGGAGTALGLTSDGTIWTWGTDWSQQPVTPFSSRLRALQGRIAGVFKPASPTGGITSIPVFQEKPRPLMLLQATGTNQSVTETSAVNAKVNSP